MARSDDREKLAEMLAELRRAIDELRRQLAEVGARLAKVATMYELEACGLADDMAIIRPLKALAESGKRETALLILWAIVQHPERADAVLEAAMAGSPLTQPP